MQVHLPGKISPNFTNSNTTGVTSGAGNAYLSVAPEFTPAFLIEVRVIQSIFFEIWLGFVFGDTFVFSFFVLRLTITTLASSNFFKDKHAFI